MRVLAGDIGGTNARLALFEEDRILFQRQYPSSKIKGIEQAFELFQAEIGAPLPEAAAIAVAGVVEDQCVSATNIPWTLCAESIRKNTGFEKVILLNDFEAAAWGTLTLKTGELIPLGGGSRDPSGPRAVLGAGTGLGQALVVPCESGSYRVLPTEGGHTDFAPRGEEQIQLLEFLLQEREHVSVEQVLSGPGLVNIYRFLEDSPDLPDEPDVPAWITREAMSDPGSTAARALRIFVEIYGAEAGNLALKSLATGGVYIAGGIAPRILDALAGWGFREAFEAKGRMKKVMKKIPTWVVTDTNLGLRGAAHLLRISR